MTLFTPAEALLGTGHVIGKRTKEFRGKRDQVIFVLRTFSYGNMPTAFSTAEEIGKIFESHVYAPKITTEGTDILPAAAALTGAWLFLSQEAQANPALVDRIVPHVIQKTWCALAATSRAEREELHGLMAPVWPWLNQNKDALAAHAGEQKGHLQEILNGVPRAYMAGSPVQRRSGIVNATLEAG